MPIFTDALLGDTLHLHAEEFGAYCLLLFATWRNNGQALAEDDRKLARICRVTTRRWSERLKPVLREFFDTGDGKWHQKRLEKEWKHVEHIASEQSRKGQLSALKRWQTPVTDPSERLQPNGNPLNHTHKKEENPPTPLARGANGRGNGRANGTNPRAAQWPHLANLTDHQLGARLNLKTIPRDERDEIKRRLGYSPSIQP